MKRKGPPRGDKFDPLGLLLMELRVKIEMSYSRCFCTSSATLLSSGRGNCNALNRKCRIRKSRLIGCHCELYRLTSHFNISDSLCIHSASWELSPETVPLVVEASGVKIGRWINAIIKDRM